MRRKVLSASTSTFEWIDVSSPDSVELENLAVELNIPPLNIQDVLQAEHLPKSESIGEDGSFFLISRAIDPENKNLEFQSFREISNKIAIYYSRGSVITLHRRQFPWLEDLIQKSQAFPDGTTALHLVARILKHSFRSYESALFRLLEDVEFFEAKLLNTERIPAMARSLYSLRRKSSILKQLFTLSDPLAEFLSTEVPGDPIAQDALDMFQRIKNLCDDLNERTVGLINLNLSIAGQRNNDVMRFLTVYSAFFMPLTFLVGVYGMNFRFMPEIESSWGYPMVWLLMISITLVHLWWFRRKRWL
jgi:magnesium transporter